MHLESVSIKNFRCYRDEVTVHFSDLTTFIGRNDIGKSSVLEALEIFLGLPGIVWKRRRMMLPCVTKISTGRFSG